ncbi:MAG: hypothetical protein PHE78_00795 [Candidatus Gastranaerophilales bacterium]|nr:hypothetical protein [Candidatus Gastranaerophilales bacterium]
MFSAEKIKEGQDCYGVFDYSIDTLKNIIKNSTMVTEEFLEDKLQSEYFETYFNEIGAKTIIVESNYIDNYYLEDYSSYYAKCFKPYDRRCSRLHFFAEEFNIKNFKEVLSSQNQKGIELLQGSYLGFITIKKLPKSFLGYTCLKTYDENNFRNFPVIRDYKINLFGITLSVNSLAYQEQDRVVAACATSALWSMFHGTGKLFQHSIPSPVQITRYSTDGPCDSRVFPNYGLTLDMIAQGIKKIGLEPYKVNINSSLIFTSTLYAYLKAQIPILMGFKLFNVGAKDVIGTKDEDNYIVGYHAVAVTGYYLDKTKPMMYENNLCARSSSISKIYVHDDQVGPYAKMEINPFVPSFNGFYLTTSWGRENKTDKYIAIPYAFSVPLDANIRIPLSKILDEVSTFDFLIKKVEEAFMPNSNERIFSDIQWDIYLDKSSNLKNKLLLEPIDGVENIEKILTNSLPRYIWCCDILKNKKEIIKIIFDATDIEQNSNLATVIVSGEGKEMFDRMKDISKGLYEKYPGTRSNEFVGWLSAQTF